MSFQPVDAYLHQVVADRLIPGAVIRVEQHGELRFETAVGLRHTRPALPMSTQTLFDIASLTKVVGTLGTLLSLFEAGAAAPEQRLGEFLPVRPDKQGLTIGQCLTHTAGLPAFAFLRESAAEVDELDLE